MTAILAAVTFAAALACPAHMLWRMRRGHTPGCLPSRRPVDQLADREARLANELDRLANPHG